MHGEASLATWLRAIAVSVTRNRLETVLREVLGRGSLGGDLHVLLGSDAATSGLHIFSEQHGFLLALLPPGAFILLGLGLAWRQARKAATSASHRVVTSGTTSEAAT